MIMKKTLILITTIILALSMVSCNIQEFINGWGGTSTTSSEMTTSNTTSTTTTKKEEPTYVLLKDILPSKDQIAYVKVHYTSLLSSQIPYDNIIDVDKFYDLIPEADVVMISDEENNIEIHNKIMNEAWIDVRRNEEYLLFYIFGYNGYIGHLNIYPNSTLLCNILDGEFMYCSVEKSGISVVELFQEEGWKR